LSAVQRAVAALSEALGAQVHLHGHRPVGGGSVAEALRLDTDHGPFFMKAHGGPGALFSAEAAGLAALAQAGPGLVVPGVLAHADPGPEGPGFLVLEWLAPGPAPDPEVVGRGLARLHRLTSSRGFGFERDTYCGGTLQPNGWSATWIDFYRERRLGHQLRLLVDAGRLDAATRRRGERLLARLEDRLDGPPEPPALIHGDLWSGNLMATARGPALVDPSVAYAHREAELGMMTLFGGFSPAVFAAYQEAWPLAPGWRARGPLYELYHVMNHATLFGGGYVAQAQAIIARYA
jgi:protein-ribulosamine 3-kinase